MAFYVVSQDAGNWLMEGGAPSILQHPPTAVPQSRPSESTRLHGGKLCWVHSDGLAHTSLVLGTRLLTPWALWSWLTSRQPPPRRGSPHCPDQERGSVLLGNTAKFYLVGMETQVCWSLMPRAPSTFLSVPWALSCARGGHSH